MTYILKNWKVVIISLIGATTFWFFNALNKNYDANIDYPVEFTFSRDSNVVMVPLPSSVRLNVSSGGWNLLRKTLWFNVPPIEISLDQPASTKYIDRGQLFPIVVNQMSELKVNHIVSDSLRLAIEPRSSKVVALRLDPDAIPLEDDYRVVSTISIIPDSIRIIGPSSFIDTLRDQYPLVLNLQGIDESVNEEILLNFPNGLIQSQPPQVNIAFDVEQFLEQSIIVSMELVGFPSDSSVYAETQEITVNYLISDSEQRDFVPSEFAVLADLSTIDPADSTIMPLLLFYPPEVKEASIKPDQVQVIYE